MREAGAQKRKKSYEEKVSELRRKFSIAKSEMKRIKENRKITKKGKKNRQMLLKKYKTISVAGLVGLMEKCKTALRKLKKGFHRNEKQEEARVLNQQFKTDPGRVYEKMRELSASEANRPKFVNKNNSKDIMMFENIGEASEFWRNLWENEAAGTGNTSANWLQEVKSAIMEHVPLPSEEDWVLETAEATRTIKKKRNWSAPGPDKLANYWWKRAHPLHAGMAQCFEAITKSAVEYPLWFPQGKRHSSPKPGTSQVTITDLSRA